jgi:citrate lyase subunit beta/citryl-CoA lyase
MIMPYQILGATLYMKSFIAPLFVPANRPDRFEKAATSGADAIIVDLEDAVPPNSKAEARQNLRLIRDLQIPAFVRCNGEGAPWHDADLAAMAELGLKRLCAPKIESAQALDILAHRLGDDIQVLAQIETARGVERAGEIAAHRLVSQLAFGPADFFLDLGAAPSEGLTQHVLCRLAIASRAAAKAPPLDGPAFAVNNREALERECGQALVCGAGGKLCIHPSQIAAVLEQFMPSDAEVAWAERVVAADLEGAAQIVDGRMIDAPVVARARAILDRPGIRRSTT